MKPRFTFFLFFIFAKWDVLKDKRNNKTYCWGWMLGYPRLYWWATSTLFLGSSFHDTSARLSRPPDFLHNPSRKPPPKTSSTTGAADASAAGERLALVSLRHLQADRCHTVSIRARVSIIRCLTPLSTEAFSSWPASTLGRCVRHPEGGGGGFTLHSLWTLIGSEGSWLQLLLHHHRRHTNDQLAHHSKTQLCFIQKNKNPTKLHNHCLVYPFLKPG